MPPLHRIPQSLQKSEKFLHGQSGSTNELAKSAHGEFLVLGNREIGADPRPIQEDVAADLAANRPTCSHKSGNSLLAGDIAQFSHRFPNFREGCGQGKKPVRGKNALVF
jgi:hypothetical protein